MKQHNVWVYYVFIPAFIWAVIQNEPFAMAFFGGGVLFEFFTGGGDKN